LSSKFFKQLFQLFFPFHLEFLNNDYSIFFQVRIIVAQVGLDNVKKWRRNKREITKVNIV
jgi:hypothetical protein